MEWAFAGYALNEDRAELIGPEGPVHLEKFPFELLLLLARNAGRVVTKDEIIEAVWGGRIVSDAAISTAVKQARRAVGDTGADQRIIKTVHGRGFRMVAEIAVPAEAPATVPASAAAPAPSEATASLLVAPAGRARPSVAVLPFQYVGIVGPAEPLALAVPAEVISSLSRLHWMQVIARGSSFRFHSQDFDASEVGGRLGARYLIAGSLEAIGEMLTFSVELVEAASGALIWSDRLASTLAEVQVLRMRLVSSIVTALEVELPRFEADAARRLSETEFDAWSHYHVGLRYMFRYTAEDNRVAAQHFGQAIALDPHFARAHAGLSLTHWQTAFMQYGAQRSEPLAAALKAANDAIAIDPNEPLALYSIGRTRWLEGDQDGGLAWLDRALVINPNFAHCHYTRGMSMMLSGHNADALGSTSTALGLSPLDPLGYGMHGVISLIHMAEGDFVSALQAAERSVQSPGAHFFIGMIGAMANELVGNKARALVHVQQVRAARPDASKGLFLQAFPFADPAQRKLISETLTRLGF